MPGAALGIARERLREDGVGAPALLARREFEDGRANQRVAELQAPRMRIGAHDAGPFRGRQVDPTLRCRHAVLDRHAVFGAGEHDEQQQLARALGQIAKSPGVERSQAVGEREGFGERPRIPLERRRQVEQRQGIAERLFADPHPHIRGQRREVVDEQRVGALLGEGLQDMRVEPAPHEHVLELGPRGDDEPDGGVAEPTREVGECHRAGKVEPRHVVDDHEERHRLRGVRDERECRGPGDELCRRRPGLESADHGDRTAMHLVERWKRVE